MKKNNLMQNLFAMSLACATVLSGITLLAGCSGFTEDTNTSSNDDGGIIDVQTAFASARVTGMGKAHVDESKDSVTFVTEVFGGCIKRNGTIFYNPDYYSADTNRLAYNFRNDTLQLSSIYEDKNTKELETVQFVGGTSGVLDGTWRSQPCFYLDGVHYCNNDAYEKFIKIDGDNVEFRAGDVPNYDYMNTNFVCDIFRFLNGKSSISFDDVFYSRSANSPEEYGITVLEKTNKSMKFTHEGRTFDLKLDFVRYSDTVAVTLSSNGTTCVGNYSMKKNVPPELCREENAPYMEFNAENWDSDAHASQYKKDNVREFSKCIQGILESEIKTSTSADSGNVDVLAGFASARMVYSGKALVNETQDSLTFVDEQVGGCLKKGESFMYDPDFYYGDSNTYAYGFRGDTLALTRPAVLYADGNGGFESTETIFLVGGSSGKLDGIWKILPCRLIDAKGEMGCLNDADEDFVKIDNGKTEFYIAELADYDYMKSVFVEELFMFLDSQNSIQIETPFYGGRNVESLAEDYGITVQEKTNRSMKFTYEGHSFDLKLNYTRIKDSVSVTLTSGNVVCNAYNREIPNITQEQCREENAPYLKEMESGAYEIRKRNDTEFEDCINGILGRERKD
ncbi:MAG: hypothetical protein II835_04670 [Fibrobacter sp.]|nr:hypothetical protein [Fibrobacter sp.]